MKKVRCNVCGTRFEPDLYIAKGRGGLMGITEGLTYYDACDCPKCGRQKILGERYEKVGEQNGC